ncbi:hypothetical protein [Lactobacillus helveticus]|uniref:hypothetical protein n=1 Tax=Lactobacillus helveticus TaxID=1587 RepID=UPI00386BD7AE
MKKLRKLTSATLLSATLFAIFSPMVSNYVSADTLDKQPVLNTEMDQSDTSIKPKHMTYNEVNNIVNELHSKYPEFSRKYINKLVQDRLKGDYSIPTNDDSKSLQTNSKDQILVKQGGKWKGISVRTAALAIDAAISIFLPSGGGSLIASVGRHEAHRILKKIIIGTLGVSAGWVVNYALDALDPGMAAAKALDAHDRYPHNGYINL